MPDGPAEPEVTLESFVPEFVLQQLATRESVPLEPTEELIPGAAMMVDVVGFTALTDRAMTEESAGAEQVSARLRGAFGELDRLVHLSGGTIAEFVGDGLLAIWRADDHGSSRGAALAAIGCAHAIQQQVGGEPGPDRLKFRVGVGSGQVWLVSAGGHNDSWIPIAGGDAIEQLLPTLDEASPGEVTLSAETAELLELEDRLAPRDIVLRKPASPVVRPSATRSRDPSLLTPFVPDIVRARHEAGLLESFAEYRQVSVAFVRLPGVDPTATDRVAQMQQLTVEFQRAIADFGGSIVNVLADDRGTIGLAVWGASMHTHADDPLLAIQAVTALQERLGQSDIPFTDVIPAGVASGPAFFGDIGGSRSRQHAMVGTAVNRGARLMAVSDGSILCDGDTVRLVRRRMAFEERPARPLKGLPGDTRIFTPIAELEPELPGRRPLIGRSDEVAQITFELEAVTAEDAKGRLLVIEGEAGIGKSRLVGHLLEESQRFAIRGIMVRGNQLAASIPYQAWKPALIELLGGEAAAPDRLAELLPTSVHRRRLVEKILDLPTAVDEPAISNPDAAREALATVLSLLLTRHPTLLVVEDAHWLDAASFDLLGALLNLPRTLFVVTSRPEPEAQRALQEHVTAASHGTVIRLGPLSDAETAALVSQRLDVSSLPQDLAQAIVARTEGHPLFTEELTLAVRDEGIIQVDAQGHVSGDLDQLAGLTYPVSVQSTVASRIDLLSLPHQQSLRVASVVGRDFDAAAVAAASPSRISEEEVGKQLADIERHDLIGRGIDDEHSFSFKHAIIADVAYGTLPEAERRLIHGRVAGFLETKTEGQPSSFDPAIAQHWVGAGEVDAAEAALERSARYAMSIASYQEAITFLIGARELDDGSATQLRRAQWSTAIGSAYRALGDLPASHRALVEAASLLGHPMPGSPFRLGIGAAAQALRQIAHRVAPRLFLSRRTEQHDGIEQVAETYWAMTTTTFSSQDALGLFYVGLKATNEAERIPPTGVLARGYSFLTYATGTAGQLGLAERYHRRGMAAAEAAGDRHAAADVRFNRAVYLTAIGDWDQAGSETDHAVGDFESLNLHYDSLNASMVRTYQMLHEGRWGEAGDRYVRHEKEAKDLEEALHIVWSRVWGNSIALRLGEVSDATARLDDAAEVAEQVGELASEIARLGFLSVGLWWGDRHEEALTNAAESLDLMKRTEWLTAPHAYDGFAATTRVLLAGWEQALAHGLASRQTLQHEAHRACRSMGRLGRSVAMARPGVHFVWGRYHALGGNRRRAARRWQKGLAEAERLAMPYEEALLLRALAKETELTDDERTGYRNRAADIFERLGARWDLAALDD